MRLFLAVGCIGKTPKEPIYLGDSKSAMLTAVGEARASGNFDTILQFDRIQFTKRIRCTTVEPKPAKASTPPPESTGPAATDEPKAEKPKGKKGKLPASPDPEEESEDDGADHFLGE